MKKFALFLAVSCLMSVAPLSAQSFRLTANIPFAFVMNGRILPAGPYSIDASTSGAVLVRNEDSDDNVMALTNSLGGASGSASTPALVFERSGGRYFLTQVWTGTDGDGFSINSSHRDERENESAAAAPQTVLILVMR